MTDTLEQLPPQALDSEQAALGAMLLAREAIVTAVDILKPGDFYLESNRIIYAAITDLYQHHQPIDLIILGNYLQTRGQLERVGGAQHLKTIMAQCPTEYGITYYAGIVKSKAYQRAVIAAADRIIQQAYTWTDAPDTLQENITSVFAAITPRTTQQHSIQLSTLVTEAYYRQEDNITSGHRPGLLSGWDGLNTMLKDLLAGDLVIIAARSGMGKTAFALNWALDLCGQGLTGLFFSLEMTNESLAVRSLLAQMDHVRKNLADLVHCRDHPEVLDDMYNAVTRVEHRTLFLDDRPSLRVSDIEREARIVKRLHGIDFLMVDFLQIVKPENRTGSMYQDVGETAYQLKALGKTLGCPVFALAQLNNECERTIPRVPKREHVAESGKIIQAADVALYLYWPGYYGPDECAHPYNHMDYNTQRYLVEVGNLKQRDDDPTRRALLHFDAPHFRFYDLTSAEWAQIQGRNQ